MIGRLRDRLRRLFGRFCDADGEDGGSDGATPADRECAVCGTPIAEPEAACALCGSDGVAHAGGRDEAEPGPAEVRRARTTDDAAAQLREFRERRDGDPD